MVIALWLDCKEFLVWSLVEWHRVELRVHSSSSSVASLPVVGLERGDKAGSLILGVFRIIVRVSSSGRITVKSMGRWPILLP